MQDRRASCLRSWQEPEPPMTRRILRKFLWNTYDHLGTCVVLNVVWLVLAAPWVLVGYLLLFLLVPWLGVLGVVTSIAAGVGALWLSPASIAFLTAASEWANYHTPGARELWAVMRRRFLAGLWLSGAVLGVAIVFGVNGAFYLHLSGALRWIGYLLAGVMLWGQIILLSIVFHLGLLLARRHDLAVREAVKQATFLAFKLPLQSLLLGATTLAMATLFAITQIGIPFIAASIPAVFAATGERELLKQLRPAVPGQEEADQLEEVRTLRDLLRPWDMGK